MLRRDQYQPSAAASRTAAGPSPAATAPRIAACRLSWSADSFSSQSSCSARSRWSWLASASRGEVLRVRLADLVLLPRLGQPFLAVGPDDLEHPVPGRVVAHGQQRLFGQRGEQVQDPGGGQAGAGADLLGRLQGGAAGEDREPAPERALGVVEQVPAPVHHRAQRLVPGHRGAAAAAEQLEPVTKTSFDLLRGHGAQPGRGQLDGQRHAVERPADGRHGGRVVRA